MYYINGVFCSIKECVRGIHWLSEPMPTMSNVNQYIFYRHRHDKTILSILRIRHRIAPVQNMGFFMNLED